MLHRFLFLQGFQAWHGRTDASRHPWFRVRFVCRPLIRRVAPRAGWIRRSGSAATRVAVLLLSTAAVAHGAELRGLANLSQPFPLPADALLDVQLIEQDAAGTGSTVLRGRSRSPISGSSPFPFTLTYLEAAIRPGGRYRLRATIQQGDRLLFRTSTAVPFVVVNSTAPRLVLEPVGDAPLRGLLWLRAPSAGVPAPPDAPRQEQQFRLDPLSSELTGSGDCNRFIGRFTLQAETLQLEPAGRTVLDCEPEVKADEARFIADLLKVRRWRLDGQGRLELLDQEGGLLLRMETRPR